MATILLGSSLLSPLGTSSLKKDSRRKIQKVAPGAARAEKSSSSSAGSSVLETSAAVGSAVAIPVVAWSLYTLKTTGCGLPPGPGGLFGAAEGVSYLVVGGLVAWSIFTKVKTGSGLPPGPFGLLGAVEGLSYLTLLAIAAVFGLQFLENGYIPGPLPSDQCFG